METTMKINQQQTTMDNDIISEVDDLESTCAVFFTIESIDECRKNSGTEVFTNANEYHVNYFAVVRKEEFKDGSSAYMVFPVLYYNFPQEVSGALINYKYPDVVEKVKELSELATTKANIMIQFLQTVPAINKNIVKISYSLTFMNNIHKHP